MAKSKVPHTIEGELKKERARNPPTPTSFSKELSAFAMLKALEEWNFNVYDIRVDEGS